ncbi:DUF1653 domain-containing protein [Halomonas daqiaonensis]|uniref:DUF1653 domain-containing protein n=1 Tax=Halomonas daqiaonensis TaxID=650850 RepID=A0A1H7RI17_9GAMM|nr:DUF1653 domain-containing protein [Halomonas daqiaonensis]SEL59960.1 Protein of unknown function [Halomonas daqiaonensis]
MEHNLPRPGIYRHYKGPLYEVLGVARHSETEEKLVAYRALYGDYGLWVRPLDMFLETVEVQGEPVPRFALEKAFT